MVKKICKKILTILNIHADDNQKWLLWSMFFSGLLATYVLPQISKTVIYRKNQEILKTIN